MREVIILKRITVFFAVAVAVIYTFHFAHRNINDSVRRAILLSLLYHSFGDGGAKVLCNNNTRRRRTYDFRAHTAELQYIIII